MAQDNPSNSGLKEKLDTFAFLGGDDDVVDDKSTDNKADDVIDDKSDDEIKDDETLKLSDDIDDDDDDEDEDKKDDDKDNEDEDEDDERKLILKDDEVNEEDLDIIVPARKQQILKDFPGLFKKYPELEHSYYKAQKYSEILPTIEDAREAAEKATALDNFSKDLIEDGNIGTLLNTVNKSNPESFKRIADNFIQEISKADPNVGLHVISNVLRHALVNAQHEGKRAKNEELETAAKIVNEYLFQSEEIKPPTRLVSEEAKKDNSLQKEREAFEQEKFDSANKEFRFKVTNTLKATIDDNIDKKNSMTPYVKRNASRDAYEKLERALDRDPVFKKTMESLWKLAKEDKYSPPSVDRIRRSYLSKARTLLPGVIRNARIEALKGSGKRDSDPDKNRKGPLSPGRASSASRSNTGNKSIPKGMSPRDFLLSD